MNFSHSKWEHENEVGEKDSPSVECSEDVRRDKEQKENHVSKFAQCDNGGVPYWTSPTGKPDRLKARELQDDNEIDIESFSIQNQ